MKWDYLDEPVDWANEYGRSSTHKEKWHPEEDERPLRPASKEKEYEWDGDWQGPQNGGYVIIENRREMEPGEVID